MPGLKKSGGGGGNISEDRRLQSLTSFKTHKMDIDTIFFLYYFNFDIDLNVLMSYSLSRKSELS